MKKNILVLTLIMVLTISLTADEFSFHDLIGTWEGYSSSENTYGWNAPMTLEIEESGFYTDSSGLLMPPYYYPNTQDSEYDAATNRVHFWHLDTVYAGMNFYQHYFYEVVYYDGYSLELHYNYWDDPIPHPAVQTLSLVKVGGTPMGTISGMISDYDSGDPLSDVYVYWGEISTMSNEYGYYELEVEAGRGNLEFMLSGYDNHGINDMEVVPAMDHEVNISLRSQYLPPEEISSRVYDREVTITWMQPEGKMPDSYRVYRDGALLTDTKEIKHTDGNLQDGKYYYTVTAIYMGMESEPSDKLEVMISENEGNNDDEAIVAVKITGNYPNPFNPTTRINFSLRESQDVKLEIFNSKGQRVKTLVDRELSPAEHSVVWNGDDQSGRSVSSGIYFYRLQTESFSEMRKMNLLK